MKTISLILHSIIGDLDRLDLNHKLMKLKYIYSIKKKEKEFDVKEKVLEAQLEGTKLSWRELSLAVDDNAVF